MVICCLIVILESVDFENIEKSHLYLRLHHQAMQEKISIFLLGKC